ncbi:hypothetical protein LEP1GSC132_0840 [Leptospira kirschneri str. 200803703]|uniref:Uncharacterized protein n=2 Tax=Leptospira kirschneri TaxID=29507 RepID=A0A0E2BFG4_9LEPT|nr:hypothetical protein LEP1GSC081_2463 [Leptospira kirschneri str. H1]EKO62605.1 hypothetical protein LEP1GSC082_4610 [Leptospira kirschneri str. H2]EMK22063.1 hypothetical protein LEP1GSC008_1792 [Leptospira kirschneri serovar Bulgarica str. Nikolaevo]EMO66173.1 hypothetical protein LEP1GSC132_0840 [Leptospira kirschneri str. 200803703]EMO82002.1 hypothetical protein LEP1GSC126_4034 [Leptospira kirschneri str. 200801774]
MQTDSFLNENLRTYILFFEFSFSNDINQKHKFNFILIIIPRTFSKL